MTPFVLNGEMWHVRMVNGGSNALIDRTGHLRVATTDPKTHTVYLSKRLSGSMLARVLIHEMAHCVMVSYQLFDELHMFVKPEHWIEAEEWLCNFIADYGLTVFNSAARVLGGRALECVPSAMAKLVA